MKKGKEKENSGNMRERGKKKRLGIWSGRKGLRN